MVGIDDAWLAYQFDLTCLVVGKQVEAALMEGKELSAVLGTDEVKAKPKPGRFRQGLLRARRKVAIPESGVW